MPKGKFVTEKQLESLDMKAFNRGFLSGKVEAFKESIKVLKSGRDKSFLSKKKKFF